jgi:hypothetical protein
LETEKQVRLASLAFAGGREVNSMNDTNVIYAYTLKQAIEDGVLVEVFKKSWDKLSGGKPIVATSHLFEG